MPFEEVILGPEEEASAEFDSPELSESDVPLVRRVRTGIRECELLLRSAETCVDGITSGGGDVVDTCVPKALALDGFTELPEKSLLVLRRIPGAWAGMDLSILILSSEGVTPKYKAVGDDGDILKAMGLLSSGNMGFGLCMLPSEPRRRR